MNNKRILYLFILAIVFIVFLTKILNVQIPILVIDILILLFITILDEKNTILSLIFLLPLASCFQISSQIWLIYLIIIFFKKGKMSRIFALIMMGLTFLELVAHFYYGISTIGGVFNYLSYIAVFIYILTGFKSYNISVSTALKMYCFSTCLLLIFYLASAFVSGGVEPFRMLLFGETRLGGSGVANGYFETLPINLNANTLAFYCVVEIALVFYMLRRDYLVGLQKPLGICCIVLSLVFGLLTGSRTFVVVFLITLGLFWLSSLKTKKQLFISLVVLILACVVGVSIINADIPFVDAALGRFEKNDLISMNGRTDILMEYFGKFISGVSYILFGSGVSNYRLVYGFDLSIHNGIAQVLVCYGVFGFLLFMTVLLKPVIQAIKKNYPFESFVPLIVCLLFLQTLQLLNPHMLLFPLAVAYIPILNNHTQKMSIVGEYDK